MDELFIERFDSLKDCFASLERAKDRNKDDEFVLSGTVMKYSLTFDLSWKLM